MEGDALPQKAAPALASESSAFSQEAPWPPWRNRDRAPIPGIDTPSLSSESDSNSECEQIVGYKALNPDAEQICEGTLLRCRRRIDVFESIASQKIIAEVHIKSRVIADGPSECDCGGRTFIAIKPQGFVELSKLEVMKPVMEKKKRRRWRLRCPLTERLNKPLELLSNFKLWEGVKSRRSFVQVFGLLTSANIADLHVLFGHPCVRELQDKGRHAGLMYRHTAYRIDLPLRAHARLLYEYLIETMLAADASTWGKLKAGKSVYPEIEYIVYDARDGVPGEIEPHVDNCSTVTAIVLLSDPAEFEGGCSCFDSSGAEGAASRQLSLEQGDAVIFRGEQLLHWITPVTAGVRIVLQIELATR